MRVHPYQPVTKFTRDRSHTYLFMQQLRKRGAKGVAEAAAASQRRRGLLHSRAVGLRAGGIVCGVVPIRNTVNLRGYI